MFCCEYCGNTVVSDVGLSCSIVTVCAGTTVAGWWRELVWPRLWGFVRQLLPGHILQTEIGKLGVTSCLTFPLRFN